MTIFRVGHINRNYISKNQIINEQLFKPTLNYHLRVYILLFRNIFSIFFGQHNIIFDQKLIITFYNIHIFKNFLEKKYNYNKKF